MRRGAGLDVEGRPQNVVGDGLDAFIGSWTREDETRFLESIETLEQIDEQLWR
jgi:hypothetical protein